MEEEEEADYEENDEMEEDEGIIFMWLTIIYIYLSILTTLIFTLKSANIVFIKSLNQMVHETHNWKKYWKPAFLKRIRDAMRAKIKNNVIKCFMFIIIHKLNFLIFFRCK